jgi:hypothetical protein
VASIGDDAQVPVKSLSSRLTNIWQGLQWNGVPKGIETFTEYKDKIAAGEDTHAN